MFCLMLEGDFTPTHYVLTPIKEILLTGSAQGNLALWFLLSLFIVKVIFGFLHQHRMPTLIVVALFGGLGFLQHLMGNPLPYYFANICSGLFFFAMGYWLHDYEKSTKVIVICALAYVLFIATEVPFVKMRNNELAQGSYAMWLFFSVCGCVATNATFKRIPYNFPILSWIGRNAMPIYVTHWLVISVFGMITCYALHLQLSTSAHYWSLALVMVIAEYLWVLLTKNSHLKKIKLV